MTTPLWWRERHVRVCALGSLMGIVCSYSVSAGDLCAIRAMRLAMPARNTFTNINSAQIDWVRFSGQSIRLVGHNGNAPMVAAGETGHKLK